MSQSYEKLKTLLKELFQLDQSDLDFGIYRIMNQKHDDIINYLDNDLKPQAENAFKNYSSEDKTEIKKELDEAIKSAKDLGVNPDSIPKVEELKKKYNTGMDTSKLESEVYSELYTFFKRYYSDGDFLSLRRYKEGVYAIPYEGEEVKLYWANHDQYYIKTSEYFRDYTFLLKDKRKVHFKIKDAETDKDNNKAANEKERRFRPIIDEITEENNELVIPFVYESNGDKAPQKDINAEAEKSILASKTAGAFKASLTQNISTDPKKERTLLAKHLYEYTSRNTFDYFIHKDLEKFLRRELDFFIKNEVMHLDDIEHQTAAHVEQYLSKIRVMREIAHKIIAFLAQIENFQKKVWLKKKFVVDCGYCITLDRIPESLYPQILANKAQIEEWKTLYAIEDIEGTLHNPGYSKKLTAEFLKANPYLMVDTKYFDEPVITELLASIDNIDEQTDGLIINSENFQALNLLQERYKEQVKCVYIDPPYNTGDDGFFFKDNYKHSSWMSMMKDRLELCPRLICKDGVFYASIDAVERSLLENALNIVFDSKNRVEEIIWAQNTTKNQSPTFSTNHEYVEVYAKDIEAVKKDFLMFRESKPGFSVIMELIEELNPLFLPTIEIEKRLRKLHKDHKQEVKDSGLLPTEDEWMSLYNYNQVEYRDKLGNYIPEEMASKKGAKIWVWREVDTSMPQVKQDSQKSEFRDPVSPTYRFYKPIHPVTGKPCPSPKTGWRWPYEQHGNQQNYFTKLVLDNRIVWGEDETKIPQQKSFLHEVETNVSKSVINDYADGEKELTNLFGKSRSFSNPKPSSLIKRFCLQASTSSKIIFDYFAGSGTTAHAVIYLNREDKGNRKYVLVEMGQYFNTVLKPRIQKVVYSKDWKDGKPVSREGSSHCFKYLKLESYEDTLNNLVLKQTEHQGEMLKGNDDFREEYMLSYMLDVETKDSASLLNLKAFENPDEYMLNIATGNVGESRPVKVNLVETFNYLIGLVVKSIKKTDNITFVEGTTLSEEYTLVVWRNTKETDNKKLNTILGKHLKDYSKPFDVIYVNGDNNIPNIRKGTEDALLFKVRLTEEEFKRHMFAAEAG